jgi:hypothetical protein
MQRYDFMVFEWIEVPGKGQPLLGTFTHYLKNDERAGIMSEKVADKFNCVVGIVTIKDGRVIAVGLPVERVAKTERAYHGGAPRDAQRIAEIWGQKS